MEDERKDAAEKKDVEETYSLATKWPYTMRRRTPLETRADPSLRSFRTSGDAKIRLAKFRTLGSFSRYLLPKLEKYARALICIQIYTEW